MAFMESPRFPEEIAYGVAFGPEFETSIARNQAGYEQRNQVRTRSLCVGECSSGIKIPAELETLRKFFRSVAGRAIGFRFKDWSDYQLVVGESLLVPVSGTVNQFQITKLYQAAVGYEERRPLRKPVSGTVLIYDTAVLVSAGAGAGQYALDNTTGIITLVASQTRSISSHTVGATHRFTLASTLSPNVAINDYVSVSGVTGTAASLLNGLRLLVTAVSGADVTVQAATTGLTASGGTLSLYRQADDLTAACEFDVPCRFDTDRMAVSIETVNAYQWGQIPIREIRTP